MPNSPINLNNLPELPFGTQVKQLRQLFDLTQKDFAEILDVNVKTIQRWEDQLEDVQPQSGNRKAIDSLIVIAESLSDLFEADMIKIWAERPNPALGGERPRDYVKKPGGIYLMAHLLGNLGR